MTQKLLKKNLKNKAYFKMADRVKMTTIQTELINKI
jgi:hypothetical protein